MKYPRATITWGDHFIEYGDFKKSHIKKTAKKPLYGEYSGYIVEENKNMIAIASNIWETGEISDVMYIMKNAITKIVREDKL